MSHRLVWSNECMLMIIDNRVKFIITGKYRAMLRQPWTSLIFL